MKKRRKVLQERYHGKPVRRSFFEDKAIQTREELQWSPESHVVGNLCMLSPDSRNGRTYTPQAMEDLKKLYEGARAYQDHPDDPTAHRSTKDRLGRWHNIRMVDGKLRGDLHYDPNHDYAKSLVWAVQECPEHCGVSHNVEAEGYESQDGHFTVTKIAEVRSVDVVDDPATNKSLLESHQPRRKRRKVKEGAMDPELDDGMDGEVTPEHHLGAYISACCDDPNMDKASKRKKILKALDLYDEPEDGMEEEEEEDELDVEKDPEDEREEPRHQEPEGDDQFKGEIEEEEDEDEDERKKKEDGPMMARESLQRLRKHRDKNVRAVVEQALKALPKPKAARRPVTEALTVESLARHPDPAVRLLAKKYDDLTAKDAATESVRRVIAECKRYGLPKRGISRTFVEDLAGCPNAKDRKMRILERAQIMSIRLPRSYGPGGVGGGAPQMSNEEFASLVDGAGE